MSRAKSKTKAAKRLARIEQGRILASVKVEPSPVPAVSTPKPAPQPASSPAPTADLTPAQLIILQELHRFQLDWHQLFLRTSQRMMLVGAKEARTHSTK
jgi:hypothetical protein